MPDLPQHQARFGDVAKLAPVAFVTFAICTIYSIFMYCHCLPGLRSGEHRTRELVKVFCFHLITALLVVCYVRSIFTHPGGIPNDDPQWEFGGREPQQAHLAATPANLQEFKRTGNRRNCKWCSKYKPDRAHHCRICRMCILKMDHHCPWIFNCVGFGNHKYFFLLLFYAVVDLWFCVGHLTDSVRLCVLQPDTPFVTMFLCFFGWSLAVFLGVLATAFWCFHVWLASKAMTTIEFCEKHLPKKRAQPFDRGGAKHVFDSSAYNLGAYANLKATLGENVFAMLLPICPPTGAGLDFVSSEMRLSKDIEAHGPRRLGHQVTQRPARPPWALPVGAGDDGSSSSESSLEDGAQSPTSSLGAGLLAAEPPLPRAWPEGDSRGEAMADTGT